MDVVYIGFSLYMLRTLIDSKQFHLTGVIVQDHKACDDFFEICKSEKLQVKLVANKKELSDAIGALRAQRCIMYQFGIIIPSEVLDKVCVVNVHQGNLEKNRGANPVSWSILFPEIGAQITAHIITDEIDKGWVIAEEIVDIDENDTVTTLSEKLEEKIPNLLSAIYISFKNNNFSEYKIIENGTYRERISEHDYTIDLKKDSWNVVRRKINSQTKYKGAILFLHGKKLFVKKYFENGDLLFDDETILNYKALLET